VAQLAWQEELAVAIVAPLQEPWREHVHMVGVPEWQGALAVDAQMPSKDEQRAVVPKHETVMGAVRQPLQHRPVNCRLPAIDCEAPDVAAARHARRRCGAPRNHPSGLHLPSPEPMRRHERHRECKARGRLALRRNRQPLPPAPPDVKHPHVASYAARALPSIQQQAISRAQDQRGGGVAVPRAWARTLCEVPNKQPDVGLKAVLPQVCKAPPARLAPVNVHVLPRNTRAVQLTWAWPLLCLWCRTPKQGAQVEPPHISKLVAGLVAATGELAGTPIVPPKQPQAIIKQHR
jgi:hypothetical protein